MRFLTLLVNKFGIFADFETNLMIFRVQGNHKGLFSRNRQPKQVVREFKKRWTAIPNYNYKKK